MMFGGIQMPVLVVPKSETEQQNEEDSFVLATWIESRYSFF